MGFACAAALLLAACAPAAAPSPQQARAAIEAAMRDSAAGWNAGDLDRFMRVYADDPATSFVTKDGLIRGKSTIAARYAPSFAGGGNSRGALDFTFLDFRMVGPEHALLTARYRLTPATAGGEVVQGPTTLLFRKTDAGWRIVADHSG
ncbi:YybH family protein [Sphingomonas gilva]|uniref:YybH family protein n=1 Tax=Sphingomonas gilva TaxID=2305907 RepID=UPI0024830EFF|nr:SgcJ/EcaC family oxidoreductase [Sphingomonas gilva]